MEDNLDYDYISRGEKFLRNQKFEHTIQIISQWMLLEMLLAESGY